MLACIDVLRAQLTRSWPAQANLALSCKAFEPLILAGKHAVLGAKEGGPLELVLAFNAVLAKHPNNFETLCIVGDEYVGADDPMPALPPLLYGCAAPWLQCNAPYT